MSPKRNDSKCSVAKQQQNVKKMAPTRKIDDVDAGTTEDASEADEEQEVRDHGKPKRAQSTKRSGSRNSAGRPRRSTVGRKTSYADVSSSEESNIRQILRKRKRSQDSVSDSEYNPSGRKGRKRKVAKNGQKGMQKSQRPDDDQIYRDVEYILNHSNHNHLTMKMVCQEVFAKYPDHNLHDQIDFIKNTVKSILSALPF